MQILAIGVFCLIFYGIVRTFATGVSWFSNQRYKAYRQIASRYRGKYENRGMSEPPTVSFNYHGSNVRVGLAPHVPGQKIVPRSRVVARFANGLPLRLELAPVLRPAPPQAPKGTRIVRLGQSDFDRQFIVQANDPDMAQAFLSAEVQKALIRLMRMITR